jgi:hypothetical protein
MFEIMDLLKGGKQVCDLELELDLSTCLKRCLRCFALTLHDNKSQTYTNYTAAAAIIPSCPFLPSSCASPSKLHSSATHIRFIPTYPTT